MERIIDLSGGIESGLWGYHELPGLEKIVPRVEVTHVATVREQEFFASKIVLSTISGTYVEAGSHILEDGKRLDEYPVSAFIRPAKVVKLPEQGEKALIDGALVARHAPRIEKGDALLIATGWGRMWNKPGYVTRCPNMLRNAIEWVLEQDIGIFGVDIPCIEAAWSDDQESEKGGLLGELFKKGVLLVAPLVNLEAIRGSSGRLLCLPLNLKGTSGAPARVVFIEEV